MKLQSTDFRSRFLFLIKYLKINFVVKVLSYAVSIANVVIPRACAMKPYNLNPKFLLNIF